MFFKFVIKNVYENKSKTLLLLISISLSAAKSSYCESINFQAWNCTGRWAYRKSRFKVRKNHHGVI